MPEAPTHVVLLNGGAGSISADVATVIRSRFEAHGIESDIRTVEQGDDMGEATRRAMQGGPQVIVAGGGDGTLNAVAGALIGSGITLGVLPLGTLNHFAKDARIPMDVAAAIDIICTGRIAKVDVGRVNGRVFLNNSSLGLYPQVVQRRDRLVQRLGHPKWPAFVWAATAVLRRYPFVDVRLVVEGKSLAYRTPLLFVGNNEYVLDGLLLGARERLDAGCLSIYIVKPVGRLGLAMLALRALFGGLRSAADFASLCATEIEVTTRRSSLKVAVDGEVVRMQSPLSYQVRPGSLAVMVAADRR